MYERRSNFYLFVHLRVRSSAIFNSRILRCDEISSEQDLNLRVKLCSRLICSEIFFHGNPAWRFYRFRLKNYENLKDLKVKHVDDSNSIVYSLKYLNFIDLKVICSSLNCFLSFILLTTIQLRVLTFHPNMRTKSRE